MNGGSSFWFPAKQYGWGWGPPVRWQGWFVLGLYLALVFAGIYHFKGERSGPVSLVYLGCLTVVLMAVVALKGEKPLGWRWGKR
jgi:hypothetical protein